MFKQKTAELLDKTSAVFLIIYFLILLPLTVTLILDFNLETVVYRGGLMIIVNDEISGYEKSTSLALS